MQASWRALRRSDQELRAALLDWMGRPGPLALPSPPFFGVHGLLALKLRSLLLMLVLGAAAPRASFAQEAPPATQATQATGLATSLLEEAKRFLGTPYRYGGRSPRGFDCSGFVGFVFESYGIRLPRASVHQAREGESVDLGEIQAGDLLFFKTRGRKHRISHVGIYLGEGQFIHAGAWGGRKSRCVKISDLDGSYYVQRLASARRVLGPASALLDIPRQVHRSDKEPSSEARLEP
jgi:hypothetical protein